MREVPLMPIAAACIVAGTVVGIIVAAHLKPAPVDADEGYVEDFSAVLPSPAVPLPTVPPAVPDEPVAEPARMEKPKPKAQPKPKPVARKLPTFRGFEESRYQRYDKLLVRLVDDFNVQKADWAGATVAQSKSIRNLDPALIKAQIIQESGGSAPRSRAA